MTSDEMEQRMRLLENPRLRLDVPTVVLQTLTEVVAELVKREIARELES